MNASVSAGVVVKRITDNSSAFGWEVLFVLREDGTYGIPAGRLERETPRQCAIREFREETGYDVILEGLLRVITLSAGKEHPFSIGFIFKGQLGKCVGKGEKKLEWIRPQKFRELLGEDKIFLPQFHIPAFWDRDIVPLDVVFETVV